MFTEGSATRLGVPNGHRKLARTPSLAVQTATAASVTSPVMDWLHYHQHQPPTLTINTKMAMTVDNTGPLSPQGSVTSSGSGGSDGHNDDIIASHSAGSHSQGSDPTGMKGWFIHALLFLMYSVCLYVYHSLTYLAV